MAIKSTHPAEFFIIMPSGKQKLENFFMALDSGPG